MGSKWGGPGDWLTLPAELLKPFSVLKKTEHDRDFKTLSQTLFQVTEKPRTTAQERQQKRLQEQVEAAQRKLERE
ncbi:MAG: hypothetical protein ACRCXC_03325 [Legionella sp.]